jgi:hypothetical protein
MTAERTAAPEVDLLDDDDVTALCDAAVAWLCDDVIAELTAHGEPPVFAELHLLAGLARCLEQRLPQAVRHARAQWLTWDDIGAALGISGSAARRRHDRHVNASKGAPIDP